MSRILNRCRLLKLLAFMGTSGTLLAFPGCGSHWWDYVFDAGAGFLSAQLIKGILGISPV